MRWFPVLQNVTVPPAVDRFVEGITTTQGRLTVSLGVLVVALAVAVVLAPVLVRRTAAAVRERVPAGRASAAVDRVGGYVPTTLGGLLLRTVQVAILLTAAVALLVVWGLVGVAVDVLTLIGLSVPLLGQVAATLALALAGYVGSDVLVDSVARFADGSDRVTEHQQEIILRVGNLGLLALVVAGALTIWGVDLSGLLVGAGFLGIVVGLAARQTLGSLIAGFVLMFSRPFTIGDWVEIGDDEGIVTEITIVNTRIENFDGETVVIPNDRVSNQPITNRSQRGHLRIRLDVGVDYATDTDRATEVAQEALDGIDHITEAPPPRVVPKSFGDSAVVLELRFWIDRPTPPKKWQAIGSAVRSIKAAFDREGIKIPYPQRELSGRAETGGFRISDNQVPAQATPRDVEPEPEPEPEPGPRSGSGSNSGSGG
jgi:small-conductance mechanosensitive channel